MPEQKAKQKLVFIAVGLLIICIILGNLISASIARINFQGRLTKEIPVNPLIFLTAGGAIGMAVSMLKNKNLPKNAKFAVLVFTVTYSIILFLISNETSTGVNFNISVLQYLTMFVCFFAALPFFFEKFPLKFSIDRAERDFVFFTTIVMWLSTLLSDLFIWIKWGIQGVFWDYIKTMTLGGEGFNDVLFYYGFWAFITSFSFGIINRFLINKGVSQKSGYIS